MKKLCVLMSLVFVVGLDAGCKKLVQKAAEKAAQKATGSSSAGSASAGAAKKQAGVNYFEDASSIPVKFNAFFNNNPVRPLELLIYPGYANAQIQDPKTPLNVDAYSLRGDVERTGPVKFTGKQPTEKDLANATFDLKDVDFAKISQMVKEAPTNCEVPDGKVSHLIIKKPLPFSNKTSVRVYVSGERHDGNLEYNLDGSVKKVYK
jgi:hypothetical protein